MTWSFLLHLAPHQRWGQWRCHRKHAPNQWRCKSKGQFDDAMGAQDDSLIINFKLNLQFEQCDSVLPPSPSSSAAMTSMEMQIQWSSWWCHGRLRGSFDNQFQSRFAIWTLWLDPSSFTLLLASDDVNQFPIKFIIWTVWLGPSAFISFLASNDVNGDATANVHPMTSKET